MSVFRCQVSGVRSYCLVESVMIGLPCLFAQFPPNSPNTNIIHLQIAFGVLRYPGAWESGNVLNRSH